MDHQKVMTDGRPVWWAPVPVNPETTSLREPCELAREPAFVRVEYRLERVGEGDQILEMYVADSHKGSVMQTLLEHYANGAVADLAKQRNELKEEVKAAERVAVSALVRSIETEKKLRPLRGMFLEN
jgi:hypothetical protein